MMRGQAPLRGGATGSKGHNQLITFPPYICMGVPISLLYPWYLATKVSLSCFFVVSNASSSPVPFVNDFLGYHLADLCDLGQQGKLL